MSRNNVKPYFPRAPDQYSSSYMAEVVRQFSVLLNQLQNPGDARNTQLTLTNIPTDDQGLETGAVYNFNGYLKITVPEVTSLRGVISSSTIGSVTVSIS
tara:strand:- start:742 stop:1038 length:297 start_codon:yes stop_codon:yes gene_type:complete